MGREWALTVETLSLQLYAIINNYRKLETQTFIVEGMN